MSLPLDDDLQAKVLTVPQKDEGPQYTKKGTLRLRRPKTKNNTLHPIQKKLSLSI